MATNVILPALGMAQDTGKIVEWLKSEGEAVTAEGEPLVVIETDKATVDLEAPATGILSRLAANVGDEVPVAQVIAVILSPEEAEDAADQPAPCWPMPLGRRWGMRGRKRNNQREQPGSATIRQSSRARDAMASPGFSQGAAYRGGRGVDLTSVNRGSGPGGVVLAADVLAPPGAFRANTPIEPPEPSGHCRIP